LPFSKHGSRLSTRSWRNRLGPSSGWTAWKGKCTGSLVHSSPSLGESESTTPSNSCQRGGTSLLLLQQALRTRDLHPPPPLLEFPMDEDDSDSGVPALSVNTRMTPLDVQDVGPAPMFRSESAAVPVPEPAPAPSSVDPPHPPTVEVIPATPQGSQKLAGPTPIAPPVHRTSPPLAAIAEAQPPPPPPPPHPVPCGRSRTPAINASRLGIREGPTTRARSRSKTLI